MNFLINIRKQYIQVHQTIRICAIKFSLLTVSSKLLSIGLESFRLNLINLTILQFEKTDIISFALIFVDINSIKITGKYFVSLHELYIIFYHDQSIEHSLRPNQDPPRHLVNLTE